MPKTTREETELGDTITTKILADGIEDITIESTVKRPRVELRIVEDSRASNPGRVWPSAR